MRLKTWRGAMKYTHGVVAKCLYSADKKHCVDIIARDDGMFQFYAHQEITEPDDTLPAKTLTYWVPEKDSGIFPDAETAEREARAVLTWLRDSG
jgi:hypothetical protein